MGYHRSELWNLATPPNTIAFLKWGSTELLTPDYSSLKHTHTGDYSPRKDYSHNITHESRWPTLQKTYVSLNIWHVWLLTLKIVKMRCWLHFCDPLGDQMWAGTEIGCGVVRYAKSTIPKVRLGFRRPYLLKNVQMLWWLHFCDPALEMGAHRLGPGTALWTKKKTDR